jgi:hypothetical protein
VFGLATARLVWGLFAAGEPVVFVSRYGIRDLRVAAEFILWDSVLNVSACQCGRQRFVVLTITAALENRLFAGVLAANRAFGLDGIAIGAGGLAADFDGLLEVCTALHAAARRGVRSEPTDHGAGEPHLTARFA